MRVEGKKITVWPSTSGGTNWQHFSFSPRTGLLYINTLDLGMTYEAPEPPKLTPGTPSGPPTVKRTTVTDDPNIRGYLKAVDPLTGKAKWQTPYQSPNYSSTMVTASNLVFTGVMTGEFQALDADTGKILWSFQTPSGIVGQPVTWEKDGKQYVTVLSGTRAPVRSIEIIAGKQMTSDDRTPALLLDNVVKTYGQIRAVDGVSLKAYAGEFIALLGPNGAGKSTLFQLLSGLFVPDSGRIEVMGHDMLRHPVPALAKLGIVFQQPTLDLELTITGNLLFHAGLHGIPRAVAQARIANELARLGLKDRAHDKTSQLSGGNRRRVELARALLHEPSVLLMDEATVGLDPASRGDLLKLLLKMRAERSVAVLWATHLCDEVSDADRVVVLHRGKVLTDTTPTAFVTAQSAATIEEAFLKMTGPALG